MGNCLRCFIACALPFGALDVVRVLHVDGSIDEYRHRITAGEVMKANPKHVLALPVGEGLVKKPSFLHPEAELRKGKIYFLVPAYALHKESKPKRNPNPKPKSNSGSAQAIDGRSCSSPMECRSRPLREPRSPPQRPSNCEEQQRMIGRRRGNIWKPALESIPEVEGDESPSWQS